MKFDENAKAKKIQEKIDTLQERHRTYINQMFQDAPADLFEDVILKQYPKDTIFIREQKEVDQIYLLIKGEVQALEHRFFGNRYTYMRFQAVKWFGSMEVLLGLDEYKTTLATISSCTFLIMHRKDYRRWIEKDTNALLMETKSMGRYLLEQGRKERLLLFLHGRERLFLLFTAEYKALNKAGGQCTIHRTHQEISDDSGLSIRTINRTLKAMNEDGYITYYRGEIKISLEQYQKMQEYLEHIVAE